MDKWLQAHRGATTAAPVEVALGISVDEIERAKNTNSTYSHRVYPLLSLGLSRNDCKQVIRDAGLPVPPKSACWFCPFFRPQQWAELKRDDPHQFAKAVELEAHLLAQRSRRGLQPVYLSRTGRPLADMPEAQPSLFDESNEDSNIGEAGCDEGVCFV